MSTQQACANLAAAGVLEPALAERLIAATRFLRQVQEALRLTVGPAFDADTLSETLRTALAASVGEAGFAALRSRLEETLAWAHGIYVDMIDSPARPEERRLGKEGVSKCRHRGGPER